MTIVLYGKDDLNFCFSGTFEGKFHVSLLKSMKKNPHRNVGRLQ